MDKTIKTAVSIDYKSLERNFGKNFGNSDARPVGADKYSDYREQLISWEEYDKTKELFGQQVNLPVEGKGFISSLKIQMEKAIADTDNTFLENQFVRIVNNEPVISKIEKIKYPEQKKEIEQLATYGQSEDDIWSRGNEKRIKLAHA